MSMPADLAELLAGEMDAGADAGRGERELARIGLGVVDQFLRGLERRGRMHAQHQLRARQQRHRDEILAGVVGQLVLEQARIGEERGVHHADGVAVGRAIPRRRGCR